MPHSTLVIVVIIAFRTSIADRRRIGADSNDLHFRATFRANVLNHAHVLLNSPNLALIASHLGCISGLFPRVLMPP